MINEELLRPVTVELADITEVPTRQAQNIEIEYSQNAYIVPRTIENLAYRMFLADTELRSLLNELGVLYGLKKGYFHLSLNSIAKEEKFFIVDLFQDLYGVVSDVHYCSECDVLNGKLICNPKAQMFINGQYMEIAIRKVIKDVLVKLEEKYGKRFRIYSNVKVVTRDSRKLKNEFDLVIENVTDSIFYVVEMKSGKNSRDFDQLVVAGREYDIIPDRLLLIDNCLTEEQMESFEYFSEYYVANLELKSIEEKIIIMIENDL